MRVSVFGLGYVGAVTAACLARAGHEVVGVDISHEKVAMGQRRRIADRRARIGDLLAKVVGAGRLRATVSGEKAVDETDLALICVGTPGHANGRLDLGALVQVGQ